MKEAAVAFGDTCQPANDGVKFRSAALEKLCCFHPPSHPQKKDNTGESMSVFSRRRGNGSIRQIVFETMSDEYSWGGGRLRERRP